MTNDHSTQTIDSKHDGGAIAPLWHTTLVILIILSVSALSTISSRRGSLAHNHLPSYVLTLAMEWLLAFFIVWGIRRNGISLRQLLGDRPSGLRSWMQDFGLALVFWLFSFLVLGILGVVLQLAHAGSPQKAALALAPSTAVEVAVWIVLSITAGICEELVFRGYLQQQFSALSRRIGIGILASSILFGASHGYEGISGVVLITAYGAMFSILAYRQRALRTCMMAHAFHDVFAGIVLAILRSTHQIS